MAKRSTLQGKFSIEQFNALQQRIIRRLTAAGRGGMKQHDLYYSLGSPVTRRSMTIALNALVQKGIVDSRKEYTGYPGRPAVVWYVTGKDVS